MHAGRRKFLKTSFLGLAGLGVAAPFVLKRRLVSSFFDHCPFETESLAVVSPRSIDPIARIDLPFQKDFSGDQPKRAHSALWNKDGYLKSKGGIPAPSETTSVVVIGGGISGLMAAYRLQDLKPVVLEQASQFGGNSKGEKWDDVAYTIGAAYITVPDPGTLHAELFKDLGLESKFRVESGKDEAVLMNGKKASPFWQGATDPGRAEEFKKVFDKLAAMGTSPNGVPSIPPSVEMDATARAELNRLDAMSFSEWVKRELGSVHPHIEELFREYCWSAFCADYEEVSAAQAINFFCSDLGTTQTLPGGNAGIAQALFDRMKEKLPENSLRADCLVIDVSQDKDAVRVCYEGVDGKLKTIQAKAVVMTSAKFISKVVVSGLSDDQWSAMDSLEYRAYVVANVLLKNPMKSPGYDLFSLEGEVPRDPKSEISSRVWTDVTYGTWAQSDRASHAVLSLYRPYAYSGGRKEIYGDLVFEKLKFDFREAVPRLLAGIGVDPSWVVEIRLSRWGHAMPAATRGLISDGVLERASRPFGRVFFGQQDNWASPCFESAVSCAASAADDARKAVGLS